MSPARLGVREADSDLSFYYGHKTLNSWKRGLPFSDTCALARLQHAREEGAKGHTQELEATQEPCTPAGLGEHICHGVQRPV